MSNLSQLKNLLKSPHHASNPHLTYNSVGVHCIAATTTKPEPNTNNLVLNPSLGAPALTQVTPNNAPKPDDQSLKSTWAHRAWVAGGCTTVLIFLAKSIVATADSHIWVKPVLAGLVGYFLADLASGVYHWGIDNYGNATTPIFGPQIEAFQGHHKRPWTITKRQFANNLHALGRAVTFMILPLTLVLNDPTLLALVGSFSGFSMFSQQFHAWAHTTKSKLHPIVVGLQDLGLLVSRSQHGAHHHSPYNSNYCIVSGIWNKFLDENKVFEVLEMVLFRQLGVRPRSWSEPSSEWIEDSSTISYDGVPQ